MKRFSLRELASLMTIVALAVALVQQHRKLGDASVELTSLRNEMRYLTIGDAENIHANNVPALGVKRWRWRVGLPDNRKYQLRVASNEIPRSGFPQNVRQNIFAGELPKREFLFL